MNHAPELTLNHEPLTKNRGIQQSSFNDFNLLTRDDDRLLPIIL